MLARLLLAAGTLASIAIAQESPQSLTRSEYACRSTMGQRLTRFGSRVTDCFADCYQSPSRSCSFFLDPQTQDCVARARAASESPVLRSCAGFACPECYGGSCDDFRQQEFAQMQSVV